ncbi:putative acetyl-CoA C-acetyltransferase [Helianthus annuus]|nr:putative acetyl-CoA C-acetyltransferase [Helianthus annuus]
MCQKGSLVTLDTCSLITGEMLFAFNEACTFPPNQGALSDRNVLAANLGQGPARQATLGAGIPNTVVCTTLNKVCASGMKATMLAAQSIQLGINDVVVAGGMESMSNVPKYISEASKVKLYVNYRKGSKFGHDTLVGGMLKDWLWDVFNDFKMGNCAEICADTHQLTREQQDDHQQSLTKIMIWESDGAAALVLVSGEKALEFGLKVVAKVAGYADAEQVLKQKGGKYEAAGVCGGGASAFVVIMRRPSLI